MIMTVDDDDDINLAEDVMVMGCCHLCDVIVTTDDADEHDGDYERVRRHD